MPPPVPSPFTAPPVDALLDQLPDHAVAVIEAALEDLQPTSEGRGDITERLTGRWLELWIVVDRLSAGGIDAEIDETPGLDADAELDVYRAVYRPLSHEELEAYCELHGLSPRHVAPYYVGKLEEASHLIQQITLCRCCQHPAA